MGEGSGWKAGGIGPVSIAEFHWLRCEDSRAGAAGRAE